MSDKGEKISIKLQPDVASGTLLFTTDLLPDARISMKLLESENWVLQGHTQGTLTGPKGAQGYNVAVNVVPAVSNSVMTDRAKVRIYLGLKNSRGIIETRGSTFTEGTFALSKR